jgi:nuclear pore complex protein Nup85
LVDVLGRDEFRAQAATIPSEHLATGCVFSSRLQFIARYAEFHDMIDKDEFRDAARLLVVMLSAKIVPRSWWGVILLDAGGMLDSW